MRLLLERRQPMGREEQVLLSYCCLNQLPYRVAHLTTLMEAEPLRVDEIPVGSVSFVHRCMEKMGIKVPQLLSYPAVLRHSKFMRRLCWDTDAKFVGRELDDGMPPLFVKPAYDAKKFVGSVVRSSSELWALGCPQDTAVSVSMPVKFTSEWRYYVSNDEVVWAAHYAGDIYETPDGQLVKDMLKALKSWPVVGQHPASFALDVGVLDTGWTALVEVNDGYSLGSYGVDPKVYLDFLAARWKQLFSSRQTHVDYAYARPPLA